MFRFVRSLFGCAHHHCTFPITQRKSGKAALSHAAAGSDEQEARTTYVVCLDCGKEFFYDWQRMRLGRSVRSAA
jgi:hypothetical protein